MLGHLAHHELLGDIEGGRRRQRRRHADDVAIRPRSVIPGAADLDRVAGAAVQQAPDG
jgi:hypothetical protein